jgi:predicted flap endonuclease-1-like 5' DNA nuclease
MKKNRVKEDTPLQSADKGLKRRTAENIPVFLVLAIILLGATIFSGYRQFRSKDNSTASSGSTDRYVWLTGSSGIPDGLYLFSQEYLEEEFPAVAVRPDEEAGRKEDAIVTAVHIHDDRATAIKLPPDVANLFFRPIPINRADKDILTTLPGIGPVLAERIVQHRRRQGPFRSKDELLQIAGIGPRKYAGLVDHITLD